MVTCLQPQCNSIRGPWWCPRYRPQSLLRPPVRLTFPWSRLHHGLRFRKRRGFLRGRRRRRRLLDTTTQTTRRVCLPASRTATGPSGSPLTDSTKKSSRQVVPFHEIYANCCLHISGAPFLSKKENVHLFSSLLPRFDKCHETSRIFTRTEQTFAQCQEFWCHFLSS